MFFILRTMLTYKFHKCLLYMTYVKPQKNKMCLEMLLLVKKIFLVCMCIQHTFKFPFGLCGSVSVLGLFKYPSSAQPMKMESAAEAQQAVDTAVTEAENQQITPAQIATLAQVTHDVNFNS